MEITVFGNQKQQILDGVEPWTKAQIDINLASLTPAQRTLVAENYQPVLIHATADDAIAALAQEVARREAKAEEERADYLVREARVREWIATAQPEAHETTMTQEGITVSYLYYLTPNCPVSHYCDYPADLAAAYSARRKELTVEEEALSAAAKADSLAKAQPQIDAARSAREAEEAEAKRQKAAAFAVKLAHRAEINAIEIDITRGDSREWGTPWGAVVTASRGKDSYDFGAAEYDLSNETLTVRCKPGDIIAWGQKNYRKPKRTSHERRKVADDWRMLNV